MVSSMTKGDWIKLWFWLQKIQGKMTGPRPPDPKDLSEDQRTSLLEWIETGKKYRRDFVTFLNDLLENGRTAEYEFPHNS